MKKSLKSRKKSFKTRLRELKKYGVDIDIDGRRSEKSLSKKEKAKIGRKYKKYKRILNPYHVKRNVKPGDKAILGKEFLYQGDTVWISKDGGPKNELVSLRIKRPQSRKEIKIVRTYESGRRITQIIVKDRSDVLKRIKKAFDHLRPGQSLTVKIGDNHSWTTQNFLTFESFIHYMPEFYEKVAKRDNRTAQDVRAEFEPQIHIIEFLGA